MIQVLTFNRGPLAVGEKRRLVLDGDAPFTVSTSCFVDNPPPQGFRPCRQCSTTQVAAKQVSIVEAGAQFWAGKTGTIEVTISDSVGDTLTIQLSVLPDSNTASRLSVAGA